MPVAPIPPEQMAEVQRTFRLTAIAEAPPMGNVGLATTFHDTAEIRYRSHRWRVPVAPWRSCLWLQALADELRALAVFEDSPEVLTQRLRVAETTLDLLWHIVRPQWWQRILRRNPFFDAEEGEIQQLCHFFSTALTRSRVSVRYSIRAPAWAQPMSPTPSPSLRVGIRAGWRRAAIPAATATTSSGSPPWETKPSAPAVYLVK